MIYLLVPPFENKWQECEVLTLYKKMVRSLTNK